MLLFEVSLTISRTTNAVLVAQLPLKVPISCADIGAPLTSNETIFRARSAALGNSTNAGSELGPRMDRDLSLIHI